MSKKHVPASEADPTTTYQIRVQGHLSPQIATRFAGMSMSWEDNSITLLAGQVADQAALHGLLRTVRDLGLPLISVTSVDRNEPLNTDHRKEST